MNRAPTRNRRHGQTLIFLLMVLLVLFFAAIWHFDLHKIIYVKTLSQNAGDAAALAAARWQGRTLNLIGDLNIVQAIALMNGDTDAAATVAELQARLCFAGPMIAAMASQQAAKHNRIYVNKQFTEYLEDHADTVRNVYPMMFNDDGEMLFPEPFENAWSEYADMIEMLCDHGIAAAPDNMQLYNDRTGGHILLNQDFYDAVNGRDWCWFYFNHSTLLEDYTDYTWWPPLPPLIPNPEPVNSEIFGLGLRRWTSIDTLATVDTMENLRTIRSLYGTEIDGTVMTFTATWYAYAPASWSEWTIFEPGTSFPIVGPVKPEYNVTGADAAIRIETETTRLTPGSGADTITWTAAAKPFGTLNDGLVNRYGIVLPAFSDVRLIAVDASSAPSGGSFNLEWRNHIENHLPPYMVSGPDVISSSCLFCQALITWEDPSFREEGCLWLEDNSHLCYTTGGSGSPSSGGTRRAH